MARRRRAEKFYACGALVRPRAARSTRTLERIADMPHRCSCALCGLLLVGCVAVDPRVKQEHPAEDNFVRITGRYSNEPSYTSHKFGFIGPNDLGETLCGVMVGSDGRSTAGWEKVDVITLNYAPDLGLQVALERGSQMVAQCTLMPNTGLRVENAKLVLKGGGCGAGLQTGCAGHNVSLFVSESGNLVVIESGGGAGLVTLLPFAMYGKLMSIFPRLQ